jgi:hypothetical protein
MDSVVSRRREDHMVRISKLTPPQQYQYEEDELAFTEGKPYSTYHSDWYSNLKYVTQATSHTQCLTIGHITSAHVIIL